MSDYVCPECGGEMTWKSRLLRILICEDCGFSTNDRDYDMYKDIWPYEEDDEDDSEEEYDEIYNELDHARDED